MGPRLRFAPSPTGWLHLGNARTALMNWLFARRQGGQVILRLDDTDTQRSQAAYITGLEEDLDWLGLFYTQRICQSERVALYHSAAERLKVAGDLYPCWETPEILAQQRQQATARGRPYIYHPSAEPDPKVPPHWRFRLKNKATSWVDLVRGPVTIPPGHLSDPVLVRADGSFVYTLASVVDDLDLAITHVLRGQDHVTNTAVQLQIMKALAPAKPIPSFGHFSLILDRKGQSFSKRLGSVSLRDLRAQNVHPLAIVSVLCALGTAQAPLLAQDLNTFAANFELDGFGRAAPRLDLADIWHMNTRFLSILPLQAVQPQLRAAGIKDICESFWAVFQKNIQRIEDLAPWQTVCYGELELSELTQPPSFYQVALESLKACPTPWGAHSWSQWTTAIQQATGLRGRALFQSLRQLITGQATGPEMKEILPLIDPRVLQARLEKAATHD